MMPPATSPQGGKGCSSTMSSFHLQDPAKWVQLSCNKETLRHNSGAPMSLALGHSTPSPGGSCPPGQECSPPHRVPRLMDLSSLLPLARERWQGMGDRQGAHLPIGERRKPCCCFCNRASVPGFTCVPVLIGLHPEHHHHRHVRHEGPSSCKISQETPGAATVSQSVETPRILAARQNPTPCRGLCAGALARSKDTVSPQFNTFSEKCPSFPSSCTGWEACPPQDEPHSWARAPPGHRGPPLPGAGRAPCSSAHFSL